MNQFSFVDFHKFNKSPVIIKSDQIYTYLNGFQNFFLKSISNVNISSLPAIMRIDNVRCEVCEKILQLEDGPMAFNPGPTLLKQENDALREVIKSYPSKETINAPNIPRPKKAKKKFAILDKISPDNI